PEDPSDNRVLECAVAAGVDWIVSGDRHLLTLRVFRGIPIRTARQVLTVLGEEGS
ncbi:MAG: putative toxin-antitoxin system toxin component, PIN family, partial [Gemmatimonadota bacterium]